MAGYFKNYYWTGDNISYSGTYYAVDITEEKLTSLQKSKLYLHNIRQEQLKRSWKKNQYAKVHGQVRI